jgi:hypothetical protein
MEKVRSPGNVPSQSRRQSPMDDRWSERFPTRDVLSVASNRTRTRGCPAFPLVSLGMEPPAGIEPATPSLPWNHQEPLCGPPFPQVTPDRRGRSYRFSFSEVMRSPSRHVWSTSPCPEGRVAQAQAQGEAEPGRVGPVAGHGNGGRLSPGDDRRHRRDPGRLLNGSPTCRACWPADRAAPSVPSDGLDSAAQGEARPIASASRPEPTRSRKSRAP